MKLEIRILPWCSLGERERLEMSLASHLSHAFCVTALLREEYAPAREGQVFWEGALVCSHLREWRSSTAIACLPVILPACGLAATDHPPCPGRCLAGLADSASIEKVMDQNELRKSYNYYMMTPKRLRRRKKVFRNKDREAVVNVRLDRVYLSNPFTTYQYNHLPFKCYQANGEDGGLFSGLWLMRMAQTH